MSNLLGIATSGLQVIQRALNTASNNIANVHTPGYSRQLDDMSPLPTNKIGSGFVGNGVSIEATRRVIDQFTIDAFRNQTSNHALLSTFSTMLDDINDFIANPEIGVPAGLNTFFESLHQVSNDPGSIVNRQLFLTNADSLARMFNDTYGHLSHAMKNADQQIIYAVNDINALAKSISEINVQITNLSNGTSQPLDLLDKRDQLLLDLSQYVNVSTVSNADGTLSVFIGNGQALVMGGNASTLSTQNNSSDPTKQDILLKNSASNQNITSNLSGGKLGAYLEIRDSILTTTINQLGSLALTLSSAFNEQHQLGIDLNGDLGGLLFKDVNSLEMIQQRSLANPNNSGNAVLNVEISLENNGQSLTSDDYTLSYNGTHYILRRQSDNAVVTQSLTPNIQINGLDISIESGSMQSGDSFSIQPTRLGAKQIAVMVKRPEQLALALPVSTQANLQNTGTGVIKVTEISSTSGEPVSSPYVLGNAFENSGSLTPPIQIVFVTDTLYRVYNISNGTPGTQIGPDQTYVNNNQSGQAIFPIANVADATPPGPNPDYTYDPGYRIQITGTPKAGDQFVIQYNQHAQGDNRNAVLMLGLQDAKIMNNGNSTLMESYTQSISGLAATASQANINVQTSESFLKSIESKRNSVSAVNLEEEAANLLKFEQHYQAVSQLFAISRQLFDTLIGSLGR